MSSPTTIPHSIIQGNNVHDCSTIGILGTGGCRIEGNHAENNGTGISTYGGNVIVKNSSVNNINNDYSHAAEDDPGPLGHARTATSPWANVETYP